MKMRLETLNRLEEMLEKRPEEIRQARKSGKKVVGYFCCYVPEEIIHALGQIPIRLGRGGDEPLANIGSRYLTERQCAFVKESIGLFAEGKDPYAENSDMVVVAAVCMQIYRVQEVLRNYFKKHTLVLGVPRSYYLPEAQDYFEGELRFLTTRLEEFAGAKLDETRLTESIKLYNNIREALSQIYELQARENAPVTWREVLNVIHAGFYLDRARYLTLLHELLRELRERGGNVPLTTGPQGNARLVLSGTILAPGDTKLIRVIEESDGRIVADDLCMGLRSFKDLRVEDFSISGLARAYLNRIPCAALAYSTPLDEDKRYANLVQLVRKYKADGVIYHTLRFCDPFAFKSEETKEVLKKENIPFYNIHTDYGESDIGQVRTRIEAFLELIRGMKNDN